MAKGTLHIYTCMYKYALKIEQGKAKRERKMKRKDDTHGPIGQSERSRMHTNKGEEHAKHGHSTRKSFVSERVALDVQK